jgi:diguanylate cyclase (GGDEF)-like protein/PAS domain S-box-containing protein
MTPLATTANEVRQPPAWLRLHQLFMPDYNRKATAYWWSVVLLGALTLFLSLKSLAAAPATAWWQIAAGTAIAMLAGFFPVRIPRSKNSFAAGEIFIFLVLLMHGPAAAALAAAGEAAVSSWRTSRRWTSRIVSPAMAAVAMFAAGSLLQAALGVLQARGLLSDAALMVVAMGVALLYFALNTVLATAVPLLKRNERLRVSALAGNFGWIGIAFAGSASVAALLFMTYQRSGIGVLMAAAPLLAMLLATLHFFFRQQESDELVRLSRIETSEREAEQAARHVRELEASERRFHSAFTHASIGMTLVSFDGCIVQANLALRTLLGLGDAEPTQRDFSEFVCAEDAAVLEQPLARVRAGEIESFAIELRMRHAGGAVVPVAVHCSFFSEPGAAAPCLILQVQDVSARRRAEAGLQHLAFHDSLTGLPNRRRFHQHLVRAIERVGSTPRLQFGVLFLDFDRFKLINDSMGHTVGDDFLVRVARRIQDSVRPGDVVARLGGDEFAILAEDSDCEHYCTHLAERLLDVLRKPFAVAGTEITTSASIGITVSTAGYAKPEDVLRDADTAMYKAKAAGKARYALFDVGLHAEVSQRVRLEGDLRRALAAGQLSVAYQPLYRLADGQLTGFEALARWNHPELGVITPLTFIPIAEEAGLMVPLSDFVLGRACGRLKEWQRLGAGFAELTMQINISGNDIAHSGFVPRITRAIVEARLQPQHLILELTENILMARLESALPALTELQRLGVGLSVDDFGTGYSSLAHLSSLPIDSLKLDRSFVNKMQVGSKEAAVVRAVVQLGRSLGKSVVAEGIETPSQLDQLRDMGCDTGQGYVLSRPLPAELVVTLLERIAAKTARGFQNTAFDRPVLFH